jgi:hypothetical protein
LLSLLLVALLSGAVQVAGVAVDGVVQDQTGAVLSGALVELVDANGAVARSIPADAAGAFHFDRVPPGTYTLRAHFEGFKASNTRVRVGTRPPSAQKLVLGLASISQEVAVSNGVTGVAATNASNADALSVDTEMLDVLPTFDRDIVASMARFLDPSALGTGGVTIVVNGMEVHGLNVSASAVSQIRINQDPYSAEYSRPGRGRIEILTKPGSQAYSGEMNAVYRDAIFNARNPFADSKPPEQHSIVEGFLGGPVGKSGKMSFMLSGSDDQDDHQAFIHAIGPNGLIEDNLPQSSRRALITGSITRQVSPRNTFSIRPNYQYEAEVNRDAGGTTLASAANTFTHHEQQVTYTQQTIIRPSLVNQFQFLVGHEREPTTSLSPDRAIVVAGAFTGGGGQSDQVRTETHINLNESLVWIHKKHLVQAGFQLPDWSRRGFYDHTNFGGSYYFAGLDEYTAGKPYSFTQQSGNGDIALLEKQVGAYLKDDWQAGPSLSLGYGMRYDWQNYFHDNNNVAPRFSVAYAPGKKVNVFRAGVGVFNDRSGPVVIADVLRSQPGGLTRIVITDPAYPDPFAGSVSTAPAPSVVVLAPDVRIPQTLQYSVGIDHQLQKTLTLSLNYTGARGYSMFRSRDINAPLPPLYRARPDFAYGVIRQVESTGHQHSDSMVVTMRGRVSRWFNGQMQYTVSRVDNDTNGLNAFPANDYDLSGEWARADSDRRHRFILAGRINGLKVVDVGVSFTANSGGSYSELLGGDVYNNGRGKARPLGVSRNSLESAGYQSLDVRVGKTLKLGSAKDAPSIALAMDGFNILNHVNYATYVGTVNSPLYGQPVSARSPRQLQFSARFSF